MTLTQVLLALRTAGFLAGKGYPGGKACCITGPVAAVHLEKVDTAGMAVTVEADILVPAASGGAECEAQAQKALAALEAAGGSCIQHGCEYRALEQVYQVKVEAVFSCAGEIWFTAAMSGTRLTGAVAFTADRVLTEVDGISGYQWQLKLVEQIPAADGAVGAFTGGDTLTVENAGEKLTFTGCDWTDIRWEYTEDGLRRSWSGTAQARTVGGIG